MPDPTKYTIGCEFCDKPVTFGVGRGDSMIEVFWEHYQTDCTLGTIRLMRVIHSMMAEHAEHVVTETAHREKVN